MNIQDFYGFFFRLPGATGSCHEPKKPPGSPWRPLDSMEALVLKVRRQAAVTLKRSWTKDVLVKIQFPMPLLTIKFHATFDDIF